MAHNPDRFVVIDGVQYSKERAKRLGLVKDSAAKNPTPTSKGQPANTRARTSGSAGKKSATPGPVTSTGSKPPAE